MLSSLGNLGVTPFKKMPDNPSPVEAWDYISNVNGLLLFCYTSKPNDRYLGLYNQAIEYLVDNASILTKDVLLFSKFFEHLPSLFIQDKRIDKILSDIRDCSDSFWTLNGHNREDQTLQPLAATSAMESQSKEGSYAHILKGLGRFHQDRVIQDLFKRLIGNNEPLFIKLARYGLVPGNDVMYDVVVLGEDKLFKFLLKELGGNINGHMDHDTYLTFCAKRGYKKMVKLLVKSSVDINKTNQNDEAALACAVAYGNKEMVEILIECGANVNQAIGNGTSPLSLSAIEGYLEIAEILIKNGANVNQINEYGNSALMLTKDIEIAKLLINNGANVNQVNEYGNSALMRTKDIEIAKLLINNGANINQKNKKGYIALLLAVENGYNEIAELLFDKRQLLTLRKEYMHFKLAGHSCKLQGNYRLSTVSNPSSNTSIPFHEVPLEGLLNIDIITKKMFKATQLVGLRYPDLLPHGDLLCRTLRNSVVNPKTAEEFEETHSKLLKKIQKGKPVILEVGTYGHAIKVLIWGKYFILCNRGQASRHCVEVYRFDPSKLNTENISLMLNRNKEIEDYQKIFWTDLPSQLGFEKDEVAEALQNVCRLPTQKVDNCAWDSAEASVWAFLQLEEILGVENQKLQKKWIDQSEFKRKSDLAQQRFENWLLFNQLYHIERYSGLSQLRAPKECSEKTTVPYSYQVNSTFVKQALDQAALVSRIDPRIHEEFQRLQGELGIYRSNFLESLSTALPFAMVGSLILGMYYYKSR